MSVALITHPACLAHEPGEWHPECPARLRHVLAALEDEAFAPLLREVAPEATHDQLLRAHGGRHVDWVLSRAVPAGERLRIDGDTAMSEGSRAAALRAAGGAVRGVDAVMDGWARAAFVATRPPGHHAEPSRAMGFCLFNNAAVAAQHARAQWGLDRVAVLDFDVHHGNGTQALFERDPSLFYGSTHQHPCFPGTGMADERGIAGNILNVPLPPGAAGPAFRAAWTAKILPEVRRFAPDLIVVSAGFDAHRADPLAQLRVDTADFAELTAAIVRLADELCGGRVVSVLEGGYDLDALAASAAAHVRALMRA